MTKETWHITAKFFYYGNIGALQLWPTPSEPAEFGSYTEARAAIDNFDSLPYELRHNEYARPLLRACSSGSRQYRRLASS